MCVSVSRERECVYVCVYAANCSRSADGYHALVSESLEAGKRRLMSLGCSGKASTWVLLWRGVCVCLCMCMCVVCV